MKRIDPAKLVLEGILIIVSILLAFAIDAWWDDRTEREDEARVLAALASDFAATQATVVETTARYEAARDSSFRLMGLLATDLSKVPRPELFALIRWSLGAWSFEPRLPTYEEMIGSGSLGLIRSDALRSEMAAVVDKLEDGQDYYRELFRRATIVEDPFLIREVPGYAMWQGKGGLNFPELPFEWDANELRSREFASLLAMRQAWTIDVISIGHQIGRQVDSVQSLIREAQGR